MTIFYIPNSTQYLNLTTTLLTINKQQIRSFLRQKSYLMVSQTAHSVGPRSGPHLAHVKSMPPDVVF